MYYISKSLLACIQAVHENSKGEAVLIVNTINPEFCLLRNEEMKEMKSSVLSGKIIDMMMNEETTSWCNNQTPKTLIRMDYHTIWTPDMTLKGYTRVLYMKIGR